MHMVLEIFTPLDWRRQSISTQNFPKLIPIPGGKSEKFQTSDPVLLPPMDIHQLLITRAQIGPDCSDSAQLFCVYGHSFTVIMQYGANYLFMSRINCQMSPLKIPEKRPSFKIKALLNSQNSCCDVSYFPTTLFFPPPHGCPRSLLLNLSFGLIWFVVSWFFGSQASAQALL